jgi:hypothetical protein
MKDLREWIQLAFVITGGTIALIAFFQNLKQRRVENALKFISLFRDGLHDRDLEHWIDLFKSSSELAGVNPGFYLKEWGNIRPIHDYFSEGAIDGHAIARMAAALDVVCHQVVTRTADPRTVYYELGQLLRTMHFWLSCTQAATKNDSLLSSFPSISKFFAKYEPEKRQWPSRVYAFIE